MVPQITCETLVDRLRHHTRGPVFRIWNIPVLRPPPSVQAHLLYGLSGNTRGISSKSDPDEACFFFPLGLKPAKLAAVGIYLSFGCPL